MKKSLIILLCFFLFACNDSGIIFAGTPEEELQKLDSKEDNFKITKVLTSTSDNEKRHF